MTEDGIRALLRADIERAGSLRAFARSAGFSAPYISDVNRGLRMVGPRLAKFYGYRIEKRIIRVVTPTRAAK